MSELHVRARVDALRWWCRLTLQGFAASFAIVGTIFFVAPDGTVRFMNTVGAALGDFAPAQPSALRFWLSLSTGYMALVTALAYLAQRDLGRRDLLALLALGKGVSSLTCLGYYLFSSDAFIYLANFLVDGSIAAATLWIWSVAPALAAPAVRAVARERRRDPRYEATLAALADAMIPAGGPFETGARATTVVRDVEAFVAGAVPPGVFELAIRLFDLSPFFLPPLRGRRFSRLPLAERVRVLEAWERSRFMPRRQAIHVLKLLITSQFYSRPDVTAQLGYVAPLERVPREVA